MTINEKGFISLCWCDCNQHIKMYYLFEQITQVPCTYWLISCKIRFLGNCDGSKSTGSMYTLTWFSLNMRSRSRSWSRIPRSRSRKGWSWSRKAWSWSWSRSRKAWSWSRSRKVRSRSWSRSWKLRPRLHHCLPGYDAVLSTSLPSWKRDVVILRYTHI